MTNGSVTRVDTVNTQIQINDVVTMLQDGLGLTEAFDSATGGLADSFGRPNLLAFVGGGDRVGEAFSSDEKGRDILRWWLFGNGATRTIINDKSWTKYLRKGFVDKLEGVGLATRERIGKELARLCRAQGEQVIRTC